MTIPPWLTVLRGTRPVLLIAPHGGRRHELRHPGKHKVNDLQTAEVTRTLASALGATAIINAELDRNRIDLNRLSQVRRDAPWLLELVTDVLATMVAENGAATVLILHGWNVSQAICDVGIGMRERADGVHPVRPDTATVSPAFLAERLRPLQAAGAAAGIAVTIGARYPAAHPNNLLQAFRGVADPEDGTLQPLATLCRRGVIDAVQLELSIPLRWPGRRRDRMLGLLVDAFGDSPSITTAAMQGSILRARSGRMTHRRGVQFVAGDLMLLASIDADAEGVLAGRLLITTGSDGLALFTGEVADPAVPWAVPPLAFHDLPGGGLRVAYEGPLVEFPVLTPFLDLERGLASGRLVEARLDVVIHRDGDHVGADGFVTVEGRVDIEGREHRLSADTPVRAMELRTLPLPARFRITLTTSPWGAFALHDPAHEPWDPDDQEPRSGTMVTTRNDTDASVAAQARYALRLSASEGTLELTVDDASGRSFRCIGALERLIPVRRPGRGDTVVETTFAMIRVDGRPCGWAEMTTIRGAFADGAPIEA